jgi:hypothetical protein
METGKLIHAVRVAGIALCVTAGILTSVFWVRSYRSADRLHGWLSDNRCFLIASKEGRVLAMSFPPAFHPQFWRWEIRQYPVNNPLAFPDNEVYKNASRLGFGIIRSAYYSLDQLFSAARRDANAPFASDLAQSEWTSSRVIVSYANFVTFRGMGLVVPYWFLVTFFIANAIALSLRRPLRFSLRGVFVVVTVVATLLGLVVVMNN